MKRLLYGFSILLILIGLTGCGGAKLDVKEQPDKKPITLNQFLEVSNLCKQNIFNNLGQPNKVNKYTLSYNISNPELKNSTIEVTRYSRADLLRLKTKLTDLEYKTADVSRDRYYLYLENIVKAKCKAKSSGGYRGIYIKSPYQTQSKSQYQQETIHLENETQNAKNRIQNYKEKMLLLKEEIIKDRGALPEWFKY